MTASKLIDPIALARDLIRRPSVTPADAGAMDLVETALAGLGAANASEAEILAMAESTMAAPYIGNLRPAADAKRIAKCIVAADTLGKTLG